MWKALSLLCLAVALRGAEAASARVVINEIMYHPADDRDALQYIELWNSGHEAAELAGWKLAGGIKFAFPAKSTLAAGGFIVVCRDRLEFQRTYGADLPSAGNFTGKLSHNGEKIELM